MSGEAQEPGEMQPTSAPDAVRAPANVALPQPSHLSGNGHKHHHIEFRFLDELKRRNVGRVAILYLVVCWLILEPVHVIFHMLEVPIWANRLVIILMALGFPVRAAALDAINQEPIELGKQFGLVVAYHALGRPADSDAALNRLLADDTKGNAFMIAQAYAYLGQVNEAMQWLERAYAENDPLLFYAKVELSLTPIGSNPRFKEFLRKMNLPE